LGGKLNGYLNLHRELFVIPLALNSDDGIEDGQSSPLNSASSEAMHIPEKVESAAIAGSDLVYIDEFGLVKTISAITITRPTEGEMQA
jgi:hypothetical protein